MRIESSIVTSLSELRAIEQQRIADERAAVENQRLARIESVRAAEQAKLDAEQAKIRAEREERMRIETTRAEAERDARLRVEAAASSERARLAAQLEEQRMVQELDLRRAEVAKKRPTWMLVVTGIAAIAAVGLTWFAIDQSRIRDKAQHDQAVAIAAQNQAKQELRESRDRITAMLVDVDAFDVQLTKLQNQLAAAQSTADRKRVGEEIAAANQAKSDAKRRIEEERLRLERKKRLEGVDVSKCVGTAVGCLKH